MSSKTVSQQKRPLSTMQVQRVPESQQQKRPSIAKPVREVQRVPEHQKQLYNVKHNGETRTVTSHPTVSHEQTIKLVMYLVGAAIIGVLIYFIWTKLSNFWLFKYIGSALGLVNKAGRGTSNFFRGLF